MAVLPDFEYDIFISYRHNDNRSGWVTEFVNALQISHSVYWFLCACLSGSYASRQVRLDFLSCTQDAMYSVSQSMLGLRSSS